MTHRWEGGRDDTNVPRPRGHNQQARGAELTTVEGGEGSLWHTALHGAHSSNFPSRMCSKEKGRNLKPVPL